MQITELILYGCYDAELAHALVLDDEYPNFVSGRPYRKANAALVRLSSIHPVYGISTN